MTLDAWPVWAVLPVVALLCGLLTAGVIRYATARAMLDQPGERRSHAQPTPRGGGLAIVIVVALALAWLGVSAGDTGHWAWATLFGLLAVATVGWLDDRGGLSIRVRFATHVLVAAVLAWACADNAFDRAWIFLATVALINVWNFMDGINGIAASQAALFAVAVWHWGGEALQGFAMVWLAACIGFLPFNFPKARVFLGDVGSGALGFLVAACLAWRLPEAGGAPFGDARLLFPLAPFLVDAGYTLAGRMWRGEAWWQAHVSHAYQQWARKLGEHTLVTLAYLGIALCGLMLATVLSDVNATFIKISLFLWYTVVTFCRWLARGRAILHT